MIKRLATNRDRRYTATMEELNFPAGDWPKSFESISPIGTVDNYELAEVLNTGVAVYRTGHGDKLYVEGETENG
jgi:hypothetical protein